MALSLSAMLHSIHLSSCPGDTSVEPTRLFCFWTAAGGFVWAMGSPKWCSVNGGKEGFRLAVLSLKEKLKWKSKLRPHQPWPTRLPQIFLHSQLSSCMAACSHRTVMCTFENTEIIHFFSACVDINNAWGAGWECATALPLLLLPENVFHSQFYTTPFT